MGSGGCPLAEYPSSEGSGEAMGSGDGFSAPDAGGKHKTPRLATLIEQLSRHRTEDWTQMSELYK